MATTAVAALRGPTLIASQPKLGARPSGSTRRRAPQNPGLLAAQRSLVVCAVSGEPKNAAKTPSSTKKNLVLRVEDPLAGRDYRPAMPGDDPNFWEGSKWDLLGFVLEYLWAFGILLAIVASIYSVSTYSSDDAPPAPSEAASGVAPSVELPAGTELDAFDAEDDAPPL